LVLLVITDRVRSCTIFTLKELNNIQDHLYQNNIELKVDVNGVTKVPLCRPGQGRDGSCELGPHTYVEFIEAGRNPQQAGQYTTVFGE
jgi:hypothetical protein